jgi:hypothetical protein
LGRLPEELIDPLAWKQAKPSLGDLLIGPSGDYIRTRAQDDVHVIGEDGIGQHIDPKDGGKAFQPFTDPLPTELVVSPRDWVLASQKGTSDTALDAVDDPYFIGIKQLGT